MSNPTSDLIRDYASDHELDLYQAYFEANPQELDKFDRWALGYIEKLFYDKWPIKPTYEDFPNEIKSLSETVERLGEENDRLNRMVSELFEKLTIKVATLLDTQRQEVLEEAARVADTLMTSLRWNTGQLLDEPARAYEIAQAIRNLKEEK